MLNRKVATYLKITCDYTWGIFTRTGSTILPSDVAGMVKPADVACVARDRFCNKISGTMLQNIQRMELFLRWQFLTMKAAETLCIVCLPPEKHIS